MQQPKGSPSPVTPSQLLVSYRIHPHLSITFGHGFIFIAVLEERLLVWIFLSLEKGKLFCNDSSGFPEALASGLHGPRSPLPSPGPGRGLRAGRRCSERKAHIHTLGTSLAVTPANSNVPALPCEADKTNAGTLSGWGGLTPPLHS